ncbi:MAG: hypothetical protein N2246_10630, partial [Candidatus Sumerlaeia bacterium]|nr:hypothetical protein [Candidatus Sumerlaeia bacterium]
VHNEGSFDFKDIQVACQQLGKNNDPLPVGEPIKIELLQGNSAITRTLIWEVAEGYNELEINVNPRETLNEANYSDNKAYAKVNYVVPIFDLTPVPGETKDKSPVQEFNIKEQLLFGQFSLTNIYPDYKLYNTPAFSTAEKIRIPLRPIHIVNREVLTEDTARKEVDRDNHWLMREDIYERTGDGWLEASPFENPSPIKLSIPIPDKSTTYYDVYLVVQTNKDHKGYPASKFKLQIEKEKDYKVCDYTQQKSPWATAEYYLGRYNIYDGFLDLTVEKTAGSYWTIINRINFVPLKGTYISPVIDLAELWKKKKHLKLQFSTTMPENARIECSARFSNKGLIDQWGEWQPLNLDEQGNPEPLTINGRYMQWKTVLYSTESSSPQINTVNLQIYNR